MLCLYLCSVRVQVRVRVWRVSSCWSQSPGHFYPSMSSVGIHPVFGRLLILQLQTLNPRPFLGELVGKDIIVRLKWGQEYRGRLVSLDSYLNFQLSEAEEWMEGECAGALGDVMIRCNNVLYVRDPHSLK
jgi:small nuclear ribonucleoprotein F